MKAQVRIVSYFRDDNEALSIYDIFELDRGRYVRKFLRMAMVRFNAGDTCLIEVGPATSFVGWRGRIAAQRGADPRSN